MDSNFGGMKRTNKRPCTIFGAWMEFLGDERCCDLG